MGIGADERQWRWYHRVVMVGLVLTVAGVVGIQSNGGLGAAQWPASTADFNRHVGANLDDVLAANLADMVLFVPGYLLVALGATEWMRALPGGRGRVGVAATVAFALVAVAAVTDTIENIVLRIAANDLPASSELIATMKGFGAVKYGTFAAGFALLLATTGWRYWRHRPERFP